MKALDPPGPVRFNHSARWALATLFLAALLIFVVWLVVTDSPIIAFIVRLYRDKHFLKEIVASWGWLAPVVFVVIQALQVVLSPVPGEITGPVGGALFGTWWGLAYSTIGLTTGTLICFGIGRKWGEPFVRPWLSEHNWSRLNFIVEAEGAIICFLLYLIPGFPKDIISYLFGISFLPFWIFALVSTLGRLPGTWISSYFGANVAEQQYIYAIAFLAVVVALVLPLYYYRNRIIQRLTGKPRQGKRA
ncbi:MAG: TVP38/TMEM64 family protein [Candidatus Rokuibacteriota bacterium]